LPIELRTSTLPLQHPTYWVMNIEQYMVDQRLVRYILFLFYTIRNNNLLKYIDI